MTDVIVCIDFDGTMAYHKWPEIGDPMPYLSFAFKTLKEDGFYIIVWTCREDEEDLRKWMKKHDVPFDLINEHHPKLIEMYGGKARKVFADIYVDDANVHPLPDCWLDKFQLIKKRSSELQKKILDA